jgi:hypothetical protein
MFKFLRKIRGQSTLEYAILIVIIIGALLSIQVYIKRGLQGRLKSATDDIGDQFSPGNTNVLMTVNTFSQSRDTFVAGVTSSNLLKDETTNEFGNSAIINVEQEFWGKTP